MSSYIPDYDLRTVKKLKEVFPMLESGFTPFAGGTDLMVLLEKGMLKNKNFVSLWNLDELKGIKEQDDFVQIGAGVTMGALKRSELVARYFPMLRSAADLVGAPAIQNRATIGGNIVNASPAADSPPALLCYDAELELVSANGSRFVELKDFFKGYKSIDLKEKELLKSIRLYKKSGVDCYHKVGTRAAQSISKICFAALAKMESGIIREIRIALGSVAPIPLRLIKVEQQLVGKKVDKALIETGLQILANEIAPISDIRSNREYRLKVSANLLKNFLETL